MAFRSLDRARLEYALLLVGCRLPADDQLFQGLLTGAAPARKISFVPDARRYCREPYPCLEAFDAFRFARVALVVKVALICSFNRHWRK